MIEYYRGCEAKSQFDDGHFVYDVVKNFIHLEASKFDQLMNFNVKYFALFLLCV